MNLNWIKTVVASLVFLSIATLNAQENRILKVLTVTEFKAAIENDDVQLIDVRTRKEFEEGAIKNARNIDYFEEEKFKAQFEKLDKTKPVFLYCRSGNRSNKAANRLLDMGFEKIYDLKGGFMAWPYKEIEE
ncbi:rhodanese-like domain-containing protein [Nonlabens marinus]|uniref:Protein containing rhodanese-like domain n=1 Tax=Nonlabens marinus S1-08 TaxID=1454201 RepID=W8VWU7_9FLAO|nr:rhodanese-like domain-containing protein [Nonlabens marinus]BAO55057.1 protein containing rhodanese-like domain [Nonlabens marinus S1-08]